MITKLFTGFTRKSQAQVASDLKDRLIRREAELGGQMFGELKKGDRREFFCLDENTWVWHEETSTPSGKTIISTTRYDIRPTGVLKAQNGQAYQSVTITEAENLLKATRLYREKVLNVLYPEHI